MNARTLPLLLALALLIPSSGCLLTHASERVIRADEQLYEVGFQSPLAEETFLACVAHPDASEAGKSDSFLGIPFLLALARSERLSNNAIHNDQIILCDTNGDGLITNLEALRYRDRFYPGVDPSQPLAANHEEDVSDDHVSMSASYAGHVSDTDQRQ
ncbi:MAG: hypothetical protein MPJ50_07820 [Pirellulales bacterium]|nr:hypothetical protein [Pirellulales bacterium]